MAEEFAFGADQLPTITSVTVDGAVATTGTAVWTLYGASGATLGTGNMTNDGAGNLSGTLAASIYAAETEGDYGLLEYVFTQGGVTRTWVSDVRFVTGTFTC